MKKTVAILWVAFIIGLIALVSLFRSPTSKELVKSLEQAFPKSQTASKSSTFTVNRVVDGDTIELVGGQKVRYIGINTPETVDPRRSVQCFGKEASNKNKELVDSKKVRLEKDISEVDKFGRWLRYVYVQNGDQEIFVNDYLVKNGYAQVSTYPPDVKYQELFLSSQKEAREKGLGLWSKCKD